MTFREKLELYSLGELSEQEKIEIEREIEKQEALADYLFEHQTPPGMEDIFDGAPAFAVSGNDDKEQQNTDDTEMIARQISRSIRKAFIKTGAIAAIIAVIVTLFIVFALPHVVSALHYDPSETVGTDENGNNICQLEQDMKVYSEISLPELGTDIVAGTDSYGYGNYSYYINSGFSVGGNEYRNIDNVYTGNIKRDSFVCYNYQDLVQYQAQTYSYLTDELDEDAKKSVKNMSAEDLYYVYVAFEKEMPYEQFYSEFADDDAYGTNMSWVWCGIKVSDKYAGHDREGFFAKKNATNEEYPSEKKARNHFLGLIDYFAENEDFMDLNNQLEPSLAGNEGKYISKNGMKTYGFIYVGDKEHVENIITAKGVRQVAVSAVQ